MKIQDVLRLVEREIQANGSAMATARKWGVSTQYLCDIRRRRRAPGQAVLRALGLYAETIYLRGEGPAGAP